MIIIQKSNHICISKEFRLRNSLLRNRIGNNLMIEIGNGDDNMFNSMLALAQTGDNSKPWLIAICMIVSIVVVVALFIIGQKGKNEDEDDIEE